MDDLCLTLTEGTASAAGAARVTTVRRVKQKRSQAGPSEKSRWYLVAHLDIAGYLGHHYLLARGLAHFPSGAESLNPV